MTELSLVDVINLKNNPSRESRLLVAEKICDQFNARHLTDEEGIVVLEIFRLLAKDVEVVIRQSLAEKLKYNSRLPEDIAFILANDVMQVALPILQFSPVLSEGDLVTIVRGSKELAKLLAITKRDVLTPAVSKELLNKKQAAVSESVLRNDGAFVSAEDFQSIVNDFGHADSVISALIKRNELPTDIAEKVMMVVNGALRDELLKKHGAHMHVIREAAEEAHEHAVVQYISQSATPMEKSDLVEHLYRSQKLTSSLVVRSICLGDIDFFIASVATLSGWKQDRVEQAIKDRNPEILRRLYRAANLPDSIQDATLAVLFIVLDEMRMGHTAGSSSLGDRIIERIISAGYDRSVDNMSYLLTVVGRKNTVATIH